MRSRLLSGLPDPSLFPDDSLGLHKESLMFARKVSIRLKTDAAGPFIKKMEDEIIPLLRKQHGFLDELTLISKGGKEIYAYSFWESSEDAERYERTTFREVTHLLAELIDGTIRVHTYMVANSTFHRIAAAAAS
jgi:hypothetical protein